MSGNIFGVATGTTAEKAVIVSLSGRQVAGHSVQHGLVMSAHSCRATRRHAVSSVTKSLEGRLPELCLAELKRTGLRDWILGDSQGDLPAMKQDNHTASEDLAHGRYRNLYKTVKPYSLAQTMKQQSA